SVEKLAHLRNIQARLRERAGLINAVRAYFAEQGFMEVETPVVIAAPAPEEHIEGIAVENAFLRTSPELQMKQMLCAGYEKIYQIGPCFRKNEFGSRHRPEFTMLEWYETGSDYFDLLDFTAGLLRFAAIRLKNSQQIVYQGEIIDLGLAPQIISVREAFEKYAGINPGRIGSEAEFDEIMALQLEPCLGKGRITFLTDYPAERAALARLKKNDPAVAERWELYIAGMELANAYGELPDPHEQRRRFEKARAVRAENGFIPYPFPDDFMEALESGMPECSGCALGIDRLAMIFTDSADISDIRI
ncbi:MAG: EF-P lysine aminoacylase EpmA, partial [Victivallaceae bacterium]|nr:EF-P lysine aminoacylase EpmA [Victivallaceae bacterium]